MKQIIPLEKWLGWIDELSLNDYVVIDQFFDSATIFTIQQFFQSHLNNFQKAGIGAMHQNTIREDIRGDFTYWLDASKDTALGEFWKIVEEMMVIFNRYCYLALSGYEFHLAYYPKGGLYKKHLDQFHQRNNRTITLIFYLNRQWKTGDGGELELFLPNDKTLLIEPIEARCVLFKSAVVPHAVRTSNQPRYSLTGWFLNKPAVLGQLLG